MFARLLATFCLVHLAVVCVWAGSDDPAAAELVVHLHSRIAPQSARSVEIMKRQLEPLMLSAGYRVTWQDGKDEHGTTSATLVVLELRGSCGLPAADTPGEAAMAETKTLAATASADGNVLPFTSINCAALNRVVGPALMPEAGARRDFLYGRAMARLLAHELYHVLANTQDHDREGIAKPHFTFTDLLTERFEFERVALTRLQRVVPDEAVTSATGDVAVGRDNQ